MSQLALDIVRIAIVGKVIVAIVIILNFKIKMFLIKGKLNFVFIHC